MAAGNKILVLGGLVMVFTTLLIPGDLLFAASARTNYLLYCSGCHLVNGKGNHPNVPTLHNELGRMMTVPAMREYLVRIPGAAQAPINDEELSAVINWVLQQWNADTLPAGFKKLTQAEVTAARQEILADPLRYRAQHWKDLPH
ncbi:MAG: cytochrome c [Gammaproteobacteria bacterium]|nr:cytochrome c [Gammaproteobacteria bacterium]MCY4358890.1 cytochrome c [Gammaproteobacteria bacterium]